MLKIISGGQTGVDRAALDAAITAGFETGGWCPRGRIAEDGKIPGKYPLGETESPVYQERTLKNVIGSDATLIISGGKLTGGTALTRKFADKADKKWLVIDPVQKDAAVHAAEWLAANGIQVLNVAGPRESTTPGIYRQTLKFMQKLLMEIKHAE